MRLAIALSFEELLCRPELALQRLLWPHAIYAGDRRALVTHRLAGLQHAHDPFLRLLRAEQIDERTALEFQQPFFIHQAASFDIATAHDFSNPARDQIIVLADETAIAHVDER